VNGGQRGLCELPPPLAYDFACVTVAWTSPTPASTTLVQAELWPLSEYGSMLCIGCLGERLGRRLVPSDFTDCLINREAYGHSQGLQSRLAGVAPG
jgi:hypothetical protein